MTEEQFLSKVEEMLPDIEKMIMEKAKHMLMSGCVDLERFEDDYSLPKAFLYAMSSELGYQYKPLSNSLYKVARNMSHFL